MRSWGARRTSALIGALVVAVTAAGGGAQAAPPNDDDDLVYVAMGDSYTSGPLVLPHDTTWVPQDCGQSIFNYPHLASTAIGATSFVDVSCGGAKIDDFYAPQDGLPLGGVNAPQMGALGPDVDVVTVGISGNDIGFTGVALGCIRLLGPPAEQPCAPGHVVDGVDQVSEKIAAVGPELGRALRDIHAKAPNAEIFVVSYPTALPDDGAACWPYVPILPADMPYLVAKFKEMNAMLEEQAAANGATYIDVYTTSIGHDACQLPLVAWVNGVVIVPPSYPAHPNQLGLASSGKVVAAAIKARLAEVASPVVPAAAAPPVASRGGVAPPLDDTAPSAVAVAGSLPATGADSHAPLALLGLLLALAVFRFAR